MQVLSTIPKGPIEVLDYTFSFEEWLTDKDGVVYDGMASAVVTSDQPDLLVSIALIQPSKVTAWLSGGTSGKLYALTCLAQTVGGRTVSRTASLMVV